jgi:hypothetical protein
VPEGAQEIPGARGTPQAQTPRTAPPGGGGGGGFFGRPAVELTDAGKAAVAALPQMSRAERSCVAGSIVSDWGGEPVNRITQGAGTVTIQYGRNGRTRTVHMTAAHPTNVTPSTDGHSIGKWENDVLVVDTVGFVPGTLTGQTPHSAQLHVVERFSLDPATTTLKREVQADDPLYWTASYTGNATSMIVSTVPYAPEPCADLTPAVPPAAAPAAPPATAPAASR